MTSRGLISLNLSRKELEIILETVAEKETSLEKALQSWFSFIDKSIGKRELETFQSVKVKLVKCFYSSSELLLTRNEGASIFFALSEKSSNFEDLIEALQGEEEANLYKYKLRILNEGWQKLTTALQEKAV